MITNNYALTGYKLEKINQMIDRANKTAKRHGLAPIELKVISTEKRPYKIFGKADIQVTMFNVQISGETPIVDGWEFVGTIEHTEHGNIIRTKKNNIPSEYRTTKSSCDVCHTTRERKQTYLVVNEQGEYKQIGSGCLKDFFNRDIQAQAELFDNWITFGEIANESEDFDDDFRQGGSRNEISLVDFIAWTIAVVKEHGWMSKSKACPEAHQLATVDIVLNYLSDSKTPKLSDAEKQEAKELIEFARNITIDESEYEWNLHIILQSDYIKYNRTGFAASIVPWVYRKQDIAREQKAKQEQMSWFGEEGQKVEITVKVLSAKNLESQWGVTTLYKMIDEQGHIFTWFASTSPMDVDETVTIKGTIKAHATYGSERQTQLTRCKVISQEAK